MTPSELQETELYDPEVDGYFNGSISLVTAPWWEYTNALRNSEGNGPEVA